MNKRQAENFERLHTRLAAYGLDRVEVAQLRRIEMTLQRWSERECGDEHGNAIERDESTGVPYLTYNIGSSGRRDRRRIPDAERGALRRLAAIMKRYPDLCAYHQTDPRGCALYIVRKADVGNDRIDSVYTRGVAVCV